MGKAKKHLTWSSAVNKFSKSERRFYPGLSETDKMRVSQIRQ